MAIICPFITRTALQYILGKEYLGLNSLFSSILTLLSLSELGIGTAIVYSLYKPVAEDNESLVNALLNLYKNVYRIIGIVILGAGLILVPFLRVFIKDSVPDDINLSLLYLVFLFNTVISYFMYAYMSSLVVVYQRDDIMSRTNVLITVRMTVAQLAMLYGTGNYKLFIAIKPVFTILNNGYPYLVSRMLRELRLETRCCLRFRCPYIIIYE